MIFILLPVTPYLKLNTKVIICTINIVHLIILKEIKYENISSLKYILDFLEIKRDILGETVKNSIVEHKATKCYLIKVFISLFISSILCLERSYKIPPKSLSNSLFFSSFFFLPSEPIPY